MFKEDFTRSAGPAQHPTRSDPLQNVLRACLYGRGACADFTLNSAALIKTNPTEWKAAGTDTAAASSSKACSTTRAPAIGRAVQRIVS